MPRKDYTRDPLDPTSEVLLAEHERLAALYLFNAEMGERRTTAYLTIVSIVVAALFGALQLISDPLVRLEISATLLVGVLVSGLLTFHRLVERRVRATEYLRAINRLHRYFVDQEPALEAYFSWPPYDDQPHFSGGGGAMAGLRDMVALLNSLFFGLLTGVTATLLWPDLDLALAFAIGGTVLVISLLAQHQYERLVLGGAERKARRYIRFHSPPHKEKQEI